MTITLNELSNSFIFVFGVIPNFFNLAFPEAFFIATKGYFGWLPKIIRWITIYPSIFIPFGWIILAFSLIILRKIVNISDTFENLIIDMYLGEDIL